MRSRDIVHRFVPTYQPQPTFLTKQKFVHREERSRDIVHWVVPTALPQPKFVHKERSRDIVHWFVPVCNYTHTQKNHQNIFLNF